MRSLEILVLRWSLTLTAGLLTQDLIVACKTTASSSAVKVSNGIATTDYSPVVCVNLLADPATACCTGTFVSPTTLVTAAHCLGMGASRCVSVAGFHPLKQIINQAFADAYQTAELQTNDLSRWDLAVLFFDPGAATAAGVTSYAKIATAGAAAGDPVTLVGYGMTTNNQPTTAGQKTYGSNIVANASDGLLLLSGVVGPAPGVASGTQAVGLSGDSGGPLFNADHAIVGITSGGGIGTAGSTRKTEVYLDITSANAKQVLADAGFVDGAAPVLDPSTVSAADQPPGCRPSPPSPPSAPAPITQLEFYGSGEASNGSSPPGPTPIICMEAFVGTVSADFNAVPVQSAVVITLSSTSATGGFYSDSACTKSISSAPIAAGSAETPHFYYQDPAGGGGTIQASEVPSQGWQAAVMGVSN